MWPIALSCGSTPEIAKKQVCSTVLVREPSPTSRATAEASMTNRRSFRLTMVSCTGRGSRSQTSAAGQGTFSSTVAPGAATSSRSCRCSATN